MNNPSPRQDSQSEFSFRIEQEPLFRGLRMVTGIVENSQIIQILSHLRFTIADGSLSITSTDSENELTVNLPVDHAVDQVINFAIPGKKVFDITRNIPSDTPMEFHLSEEWCFIKTPFSSYQLALQNADHFPLIDIAEPLSTFEILPAHLHNVLKNAAFCMGLRDLRFYLNGLLFEVKDSHVHTTGTDGHRMAFASCPQSHDKPVRIVIPRKSVTEMIKLMPMIQEEVPCQITVSKEHLVVQHPDFQMKVCLIQSQYPDCMRFTPSTFSHSIVLPKDKLQQAMIRASSLINDRFKAARLTFSKRRITIITSNTQNERIEETIECSYDDVDRTIALNVHYFLDVLTACEEDNIAIHLPETNGEGITFTNEHSKSCKFLIMPLVI